MQRSGNIMTYPLNIKLYADGADFDGIVKSAEDLEISGFTTNPTLMKQAGITNYEEFAKNIISYLAEHRPETNISLEVFADELDEMYRQAKIIDSWGREKNYDVYVKIPVTNTKGESTNTIVNKLSSEGVKVNITAIFTIDQGIGVLNNLDLNTPSIISVFAGRINDVGTDAHMIIQEILEYYDSIKTETSKVQFLWASSREAFSLYHAADAGCDIITMTPDLIKKVRGFGKDLTQFSLETVQMFYNDAKASGFSI
jgi:transaldolase